MPPTICLTPFGGYSSAQETELTQGGDQLPGISSDLGSEGEAARQYEAEESLGTLLKKKFSFLGYTC